MTFVGWPQTDTGRIVQPKSSSFRLFLQHFMPLTPPNPEHAPNTDPPAFSIEQCCGPTATGATIVLCQSDDGLSEVRLITPKLVIFIVLSDVA